MKTIQKAKVVVEVGSEPCQKILNDLVANFYTLYTKLWNYHVNYVGQDFDTKHGLLGDYKDQVGSQIDMLAEELRKRGFTAKFSMTEFSAASRIDEAEGGELVEINCFEDILSDFELLATALDKAIQISGEHQKLDTQQLFLDIKMSHNKIRWFIRSILGRQ